MTPSARVAAAIAVIDDWWAGEAGLDRVLAGWGRANRYAGSSDRRALADLVYDAIRRLRSSLWVAGAPDLGAVAAPGRPALLGALRQDGADPAAFFDGSRHGPAPLSADERAGRPLAEAPSAVALDLPDWLMTEDRLGEVPRAGLDRQRVRAPLHLRASSQKGGPARAAELLAEDGIETEPGPLAPDCLTVRSGARQVARSRAYLHGHVEIQDAASQAVAIFGAPEVAAPLVLDLCAGAGGKALALADRLASGGRVLAHDISAARLAELPPRAARAGLRIETRAPGALHNLEGRCDLVLVDAPCSGSGAWARNPDAKWRLTEPRLAELCQLQAALITQAAGLTRPGGLVVYATCSMMPVENRAAVDQALSDAPLTLEQTRSWSPLDGGDGFFAARLRRL
ncbi:MAG: RsmB/NOP family class I SAM-dependent RNA methyltransferase [Pikeienuella sp.]